MESEYFWCPQRLILANRWKKLFSGVKIKDVFLDLRSFLSSEVRKFTERINESGQKCLCGRAERLWWGINPNCRAAPSLTSWTKKQKMKKKKTCVCPADSYQGQHKDASEAAEVTLPPCEGATSDAQRAGEPIELACAWMSLSQREVTGQDTGDSHLTFEAMKKRGLTLSYWETPDWAAAGEAVAGRRLVAVARHSCFPVPTPAVWTSEAPWDLHLLADILR